MRESADFLVLGSGVAGLRAAAALAPHGRVLVLTKADDAAESNTGYAQGGVAAAVGDDDSPALHASDTHAAGDGLCDDAAVQALVNDGPAYVRELADWGAQFAREADGRFALGREGAHSVRRVLHAHDATGREIARVLWTRVSALPSVRILNDARAVSLIVERGVCVGARVIHAGRRLEARAPATLLATGGAGRVFRETTNPPVATGDGVALAWQVGAAIADMEFVQFHPTVMAVPGTARFLLSEALRGDGAWLLNVHGERFMTRYEPAGELASRDLVSRAIVREEQRTGAPVLLSMAHLDSAWVRLRFPTLAAACRDRGLDLATDPIPVSPAAHYVMGGVATDIDGCTTVPGLYAAGEVACTGVHGANRLASNSLLEGVVFGARAATAMAALDACAAQGEIPRSEVFPALTESHLRSITWENCGISRNDEGLQKAVSIFRSVPLEARENATRLDYELRSMRRVGLLIAQAALERRESRGGHYRSDYQEKAAQAIHSRLVRPA